LARIGPQWHSELDIEFNKCLVEGLANCTVEEPILINLDDQLVYKASKKGEEIYDVFYGAAAGKFAGGVFFTITFEGALCPLEGVTAARGSAIALPTPKKPGEEATVLKLKFMGETALKGTYLNKSNEKEEKAGEMTFGGAAASLEGEVKMELPTKEKFGAE
jgi:hypothetical protein